MVYWPSGSNARGVIRLTLAWMVGLARLTFLPRFELVMENLALPQIVG